VFSFLFYVLIDLRVFIIPSCKKDVLLVVFQVGTLDPKAADEENCTGNASEGNNNVWYIYSNYLQFSLQYL